MVKIKNKKKKIIRKIFIRHGKRFLCTMDNKGIRTLKKLEED